ncbi:DUF3461 family protein [Gynuella sp.]|uniref:DUF3461 family protein n=1 Tax=Gynuella sp. TaxID=2969146 RepID=UPI003D0972E9
MAYESLKALGIEDVDSIEKYTLRTESDYDILKIYYHKRKGELFARSEKFKYPRQHKRVKVDGGTGDMEEFSEIAPSLRYVMEELDQIERFGSTHKDLKSKILKDLRHLEKVVTNKIAEIEADLEKLDHP